MSGIFHQHLKYYKYQRVPTVTGKAIFYLFFNKEEDTYAALRAVKAFKQISLVRYHPLHEVDYEAPFRPFPPDNIIHTCRYAFRRYFDKFADTILFKTFIRRLCEQIMAQYIRIPDVHERIDKLHTWWHMNKQFLMDEPILITIPMPTIILQIPLGKIIQLQEADSESNTGSNTRCTHCGYLENEEQELNENDIESKELDVDDIKIVEIKEDVIFQPDIDEQNQFNEYMLDNYVNRYKASLSSISETDTKDEVYDWDHLFADKLRKKYTDTNGIVLYPKEDIPDEN
ncbi:unnamed protein product, partial [Adineta steineri]